MASPNDAARSRALAEESRQRDWSGASFVKELFGGRFRLELIEDLDFDGPVRPEVEDLLARVAAFLRESVDPAAIDREGDYPSEVVEGLAELGLFGMKIPAKYGGLGLTHAEYMRVMALIGSHDANVTALLSAHQAIGVPQPVLLFGTEAQKEQWLPKCAAGAISAFALTEPAVGSDPARLRTQATPSADGKSYVLEGTKLWCTNGTLAEVIVVMARDPETEKISAFIVEMDTPGVIVEHRCHFMGLRALANAQIRFDRARIPKANLIGEEGDGLRIALTTLNTGRLTLPAATAGLAKRSTELVRKWSAARHQWGSPVGEHEAVAAMNARIAWSAYAMESLALAVGRLADSKDADIRLEAAAAKEWNTSRLWEVLDDTLQVRGGRGYETVDSLVARGEVGVDVERGLRDARINEIFEGSNEIMHLFIAREGLDEHLSTAEVMIDPGASVGTKLKALPGILGHYALWYPRLWLGWSAWPRFREYGDLATHLRFAERATRRMARKLFHGMAVHQAALEKKQRFLFRAVDVALEIFVLTCAVSRAQQLSDVGAPNAESARRLADLAARECRERIEAYLAGMSRNHDEVTYAFGQELLAGDHAWLEQGTMGIDASVDELRPAAMEELMGREASTPPREVTESGETRAEPPISQAG